MKNNFLKDPTFCNGFDIGDVDSVIMGHKVLPWCLSSEMPNWKLCQWCSKFSLLDRRNIVHTPLLDSISNEAKELKRNSNGTLLFSIKSENEYSHPRIYGEGWPHLLIEQSYERNSIKNAKRFITSLSMDFLSFSDLMGDERNDELHTFQVSWHFAIGNVNQLSPAEGDMFWFALPVIDFPRYPFPHPYSNQDTGKKGSSLKFIYGVDPHEYLKNDTKVGEHIEFAYDCLEEIRKGFEVAKKKGFLLGTNFDDLGILSTNFGIEVTGAYNGSIRLNGIGVTVE